MFISKRVQILICIALVAYSGTMFCFGSHMTKPVPPSIEDFFMTIGGLFAIYSRIIWNKEQNIKDDTLNKKLK